MKRIVLLALLTAGALAVGVWQLAPAGGQNDTAGTTPNADAAYAAGYKVHVDFNGQITEEAPPVDAAELQKALGQAINTSSEGLVERPSPVAGGGTMVDLQGRFQSVSTATVDANGQFTAPCLSNEADVENLTAPTGTDTPDEKE